MWGDVAFDLLIDLLAIALITIGATIVNGLNDVSAKILAKEKDLQKAYNSVKTAANISLYVGIIILVIGVLAIAWMFVPVQIPFAGKEIVKALFGGGIIIAMIVIAIYYNNAYVDIHSSAFYKLSRGDVRKALDSTLSYLRMLMEFYYAVAVIFLLIFVGMIVYDVSKNTNDEEEIGEEGSLNDIDED